MAEKIAKRKTVHQRLLIARDLGKGIRLTVEDVFELLADDAVESRASYDDFIEAGGRHEDW